MRIKNIRLVKWRHFENIELNIDDNSSLVCIVGANGTGKSHLLELIGACAPRFGLCPGVEAPRGDPFADPHEFSMQFYVAQDVSNAIDVGLNNHAHFSSWDRTVTIESKKDTNNSVITLYAGGINDDAASKQFASLVTSRLGDSQEVHFLSLDADRAYSRKKLGTHEIGQAYERDWGAYEFTRGRSYRPTTTLYEEWVGYCLAKENQESSRFVQSMRRAKADGRESPTYNDPFDNYAKALNKILPHIRFSGIDTKDRTINFDTTGLELSFNQLSGGEREIAFLVGQIDRFSLRQGLFLLDEPELHLNADLIRTWVTYLTSTISTGQVWLATHSLEAVEAAGQQSTFVLERDENTRKVNRLARLDARPMLSALSRAVGTPAFSISQLVFVFIEGEESVGERERFRKLSGLAEKVRFMACGSCKEVSRRVAAIRALSKEADAAIRIGGIVDRDFRSEAQANKLSTADGIFVLPVHEVENFFINPTTLSVLLRNNGLGHLVPAQLVREAADRRAGSWVFQHAMAAEIAESLPEIARRAKDQTKTCSWADITADKQATISKIGAASGYENAVRSKFENILDISVNMYSTCRSSDELWKVCEGKQVLNDIARSVGFSGVSALMASSFVAWERDDSLIFDELLELREYISSL